MRSSARCIRHILGHESAAEAVPLTAAWTASSELQATVHQNVQEISTSSSLAAYKFQTHLRQIAPKSRTLNQTNFKAWNKSDYNPSFGEQILLRQRQRNGHGSKGLQDAAAEESNLSNSSTDQASGSLPLHAVSATEAFAALASSGSPTSLAAQAMHQAGVQRLAPPDLDGRQLVARKEAAAAEALAVQQQALRMLLGAHDVMELRFLMQELGQGLDVFCIVAVISKLPKLVKVKSAKGVSSPHKTASQLLDKLLPMLEEKLPGTSVTQLAMVIYALGEMNHAPYQRLQDAIVEALLNGGGGSVSHTSRASRVLSPELQTLAQLSPRHASCLMLGLAKLGLEDQRLWRDLEEVAQSGMGEYPVESVSSVLKALYVAKRLGSDLWGNIADKVIADVGSYPSDLLCHILQSFALARYPHTQLFASAWSHLHLQLTQPEGLSPNAQSRLAFAYGSVLPQACSEQMIALCSSATTSLLNFSCAELELLCSGLVAGGAEDAVLAKLICDLTHIRGSAKFGIDRSTRMLRHLSRLPHVDPGHEVWGAMSESVARMVPYMELEQVSRAVAAYANVHTREHGSNGGARQESSAYVSSEEGGFWLQLAEPLAKAAVTRVGAVLTLQGGKGASSSGDGSSSDGAVPSSGAALAESAFSSVVVAGAGAGEEAKRSSRQAVPIAELISAFAVLQCSTQPLLVSMADALQECGRPVLVTLSRRNASGVRQAMKQARLGDHPVLAMLNK